MEIWKYLYVCIFAVMAWLMTACVSDEQEGMFSGRGEAVTVKLSIDTRAAGADDFDSQVKTLRVYAFQNGSPVGYYYGGESADSYCRVEVAERRNLVLCGGKRKGGRRIALRKQGRHFCAAR